MSFVIPVTSSSDLTAIGAAAATFALSMEPGLCYLFVANTDCFVLQGANPTATAADGSMFVPSRSAVVLSGDNGAKLSVIRDTADGKASLTPIQV